MWQKGAKMGPHLTLPCSVAFSTFLPTPVRFCFQSWDRGKVVDKRNREQCLRCPLLHAPDCVKNSFSPSLALDTNRAETWIGPWGCSITSITQCYKVIYLVDYTPTMTNARNLPHPFLPPSFSSSDNMQSSLIGAAAAQHAL